MTSRRSDERRRNALRVVERALGPIRTASVVPGSEGRGLRVRAGDKDLFVRIARARTPLRNRTREIQNHTRAADAGLAPPLLLGDAASGVLAVAWVPGAAPLPAPPRRIGSASIEGVARHLADLHAGALFEDGLDPRGALARLVTGRAPDATFRLTPRLRRTLAGLLRTGSAGGEDVPLHGDPHPGNWLAGERTLTLVDFEFAGMGPRAWDLAEFAATAALDGALERRLLDAYRAAAGVSPAAGPGEWRAWRVAVDVVGAAWAFREAAATGVGTWRRYARWRFARAERLNARAVTAPGRWRGST